MVEMRQDNEQYIETPEVLKEDYSFCRLLGEGASGRTWLAQDRTTDDEVAIKELRHMENFKARELFQREAEVMSSVCVRGVPRLYKCYMDANELASCYLVQEYIPYPSLESFLNRGQVFSEKVVFDIMDQICTILTALHICYRPPIIHRDIKPANILYKSADKNEESRVWLIDFGAVANTGHSSGGSTIAGTFGYMAPEQLMGDATPRSDFYGLGATALHLLTGVYPYEIPTELFQLDFHPVIAQHAPHTSCAMVSLLDSLLSENPEHRPVDALDLQQMIQVARHRSDEKVRGKIYNLAVKFRSNRILGFVDAKRNWLEKRISERHSFEDVCIVEKIERYEGSPVMQGYCARGGVCYSVRHPIPGWCDLWGAHMRIRCMEDMEPAAIPVQPGTFRFRGNVKTQKTEPVLEQVVCLSAELFYQYMEVVKEEPHASLDMLGDAMEHSVLILERCYVRLKQDVRFREWALQDLRRHLDSVESRLRDYTACLKGLRLPPRDSMNSDTAKRQMWQMEDEVHKVMGRIDLMNTLPLETSSCYTDFDLSMAVNRLEKNADMDILIDEILYMHGLLSDCTLSGR